MIWCNPKRCRFALFMIILLAITLNLHHFLFLGILEVNNVPMCTYDIKFELVVDVISFVDSFLTFLIPFSIILILNTLICRKINNRCNYRSTSNKTLTPKDSMVSQRIHTLNPLPVDLKQRFSFNYDQKPSVSEDPLVAEKLLPENSLFPHKCVHRKTASFQPGAVPEIFSSRENKPISRKSMSLNVFPIRKTDMRRLNEKTNSLDIAEFDEHTLIKSSSIQSAQEKSINQYRLAHRDDNVTRILLVVSLVFLAMNSPDHVLRCMFAVRQLMNYNEKSNMADDEQDCTLYYIQIISNLLSQSNLAINFFLYSFVGRNFRHQTKLLIKSIWRSAARRTIRFIGLSSLNQQSSLSSNRTTTNDEENGKLKKNSREIML